MKASFFSIFKRPLLLLALLMSLVHVAVAQSTPDIVWKTNAHNLDVLAVGFSADGTLLVSGSMDNTTRVWSVTDRSLSWTFRMRGWVSAVAISSDKSLLGVGDDLGNPSVWRLSDGTRVFGSASEGDNSAYSVAFSPDSRLFARAQSESGLRYIIPLQAPPGSTALPFDYPQDAVASFDVRFSPDGTLLAAGFDDNTAKLFRMSDGTRLRDFAGHSGKVTSVDFSPGGTLLATAATDGDARLWRVSDATLFRTIPGGGGSTTVFSSSFGESIPRARFSVDGKSLLTSSNGTLRFWSVADGRLLLSYPNLGLRSFAVSPGGRYFAYGTAAIQGANASLVLARMPLLITDISQSGGQLILGWSGGGGRYQLQSTTNVASGPWQNVGAPTTATASTNPVSATIFYRVQSLPNP